MKKIQKYLNESIPNITKINKKSKTIILRGIFKRIFQILYEFSFLSILWYATLAYSCLYITLFPIRKSVILTFVPLSFTNMSQ